MRVSRFRLIASAPWMGFLFALLAVGAATAVLFPLRSRLPLEMIALLYLLPILLAASRWGLVPALTASLASFITYNYFFLFPYFTFAVNDPKELLGLIVFLIVAVLVSQAMSEAHRNMELAQEREKEARTLFDLTRALESASHLEETLEDVAWKIVDAFDLPACEIWVGSERNSAEMKGQHRRTPALGSATAGTFESPILPADFVEIPLLVQMLPVGFLRLYPYPGARIPPSARKLADTFTGQLALYLERERLAREADRAHLLEESDRMKSALLSSVSHDLRTPLAAIKASATVLLGEDIALDPAARFDLLSAIDEETDRLNHLVGDLLDMSRIEAGALRLKPDWCDMDEMIRAVVRRFAKPPAAVPICMDWKSDLPLVRADYVQIDRVVSNLLENAIRFAPPDTEITVRATFDREEITFAVSNRGPAIPARLHAHLFDKFYRISEERSPDTGTGLGLSICKGIIDAHHGKIWVESPIAGDSGVRFLFTIPIDLLAKDNSSLL
jgi:two-component system, OmpR family, sensor histidine kinase KdpD